MKFTLKRHPKDRSMVEATTTYTIGKNLVEHTLLAFVIHEDCIADRGITDRLDEDEEVLVDMVIV